MCIRDSLWGERESLGRSEDRRPYDQALDGAWGCAYDRLDALGRLPAERYPSAQEAARLRQAIFPDGLSFLKLPYEAEWAESQRRLELIASKGWEADLQRLIGAEFVTEVKRCHKDYGEVLGITRPLKPAPLDVNLTCLLYTSLHPRQHEGVGRIFEALVVDGDFAQRHLTRTFAHFHDLGGEVLADANALVFVLAE